MRLGFERLESRELLAVLISTTSPPKLTLTATSNDLNNGFGSASSSVTLPPTGTAAASPLAGSRSAADGAASATISSNLSWTITSAPLPGVGLRYTVEGAFHSTASETGPLDPATGARRYSSSTSASGSVFWNIDNLHEVVVGLRWEYSGVESSSDYWRNIASSYVEFQNGSNSSNGFGRAVQPGDTLPTNQGGVLNATNSGRAYFYADGVAQFNSTWRFEIDVAVVPQLYSLDYFGDGVYDVINDGGVAKPGFDYRLSDYLDTDLDNQPDQKQPVLYVAGSTPEVDLLFKAPATAGTYKIRGIGPSGVQFIGDAMATNGELRVTGLVANQSVGNTIRKVPSFNVTWSLSPDDGRNWVNAGTSQNTLYVTKAAPKAVIPNKSTGQSGPFESVLEAAVKYNVGRAATDTAGIIGGTWQYFKGPSNVEDASQNKLAYWVPTGASGSRLEGKAAESLVGYSVLDLLSKKQGACRAWQEFFLDALAANGIVTDQTPLPPWQTPTEGRVTVRAPSLWEFLVIKNVQYIGPDTFPVSGYTRWLPGAVSKNPVSGQVTQFNEMTTPSGVAGQNNPNPTQQFKDHALVKIAGIYYDPSYGKAYGSLSAWEDASIAGFGIDVGSRLNLSNGRIETGRVFRPQMMGGEAEVRESIEVTKYFDFVPRPRHLSLSQEAKVSPSVAAPGLRPASTVAVKAGALSAMLTTPFVSPDATANDELVDEVVAEWRRAVPQIASGSLAPCRSDDSRLTSDPMTAFDESSEAAGQEELDEALALFTPMWEEWLWPGVNA